MSNSIILIGFVVIMLAVGTLGVLAITQDGQQNIIGNNVDGTQGNGTVPAAMIESTTTGAIDVLGIIMLILVVFAIVVVLSAAYVISKS